MSARERGRGRAGERSGGAPRRFPSYFFTTTLTILPGTTMTLATVPSAVYAATF